MSEHIWKEVPGFEGLYEVSNFGEVCSYASARGRLSYPHKLKLQKDKQGYLKTSLSLRGSRKRFLVHRLVALAFLGEPPVPGLEVCHYDGVKSNNHVSNLRWDTRSANRLDTVRQGADHNANKTHCPKGHPYSVENTARRAGRRTCRECERVRVREAYRNSETLRARISASRDNDEYRAERAAYMRQWRLNKSEGF